MNILSIGNSFSQDAHRYLHQIAKAGGEDICSFNLFIGGCSLSQHYYNMLNEQPEYILEMNGVSTGLNVALKDALMSRDWDVITVQQVSQESPRYDTYQPFLGKLIEYVRMLVPKAKIAVHQTWAYEQNSERLNDELKYNDYREMLSNIVNAYKKASECWTGLS